MVDCKLRAQLRTRAIRHHDVAQNDVEVRSAVESTDDLIASILHFNVVIVR